MYTEEPYSDNAPMTPTTVSTPVIKFEPEINSPVSITTTVAPLAGVIGLLLILLMGLCGFFFSFYFYTRKRRQSLLEAQQNQNVNNLATEITLHDEQNSISMFTNSCYQKPSTTETTSHDEQNSIPMFTNSCYQRPSTTEITSRDEQNSIPMFTNSCYQKPSTLLNHEVSDPSTINCNRSTGRYDDTDVHYYDVIPEDIKLSCENESISDTAWARN
ncbi:MAG: hypothetical protein MJE68_04080 [Proteobacteria bacterium]|nr:hypothetical protein [Pseudomonadota bacterium]